MSSWAKSNGVKEAIAGRYIVDMYHSLTFSLKEGHQVDFNDLVKHAATPNGMNEQAGKEIKEKGAHEAYKFAADHLLKRFMRNL